MASTPESRAKAANRRLLKIYGLTLKDYERQLKFQGGVCAICGRTPKNFRLNIDHNHITNRIRGLLCMFCNKFVIGREMVSAEVHRRAAAYLDSPPWEEERYAPEYKRRKRRGRRRKVARRSRS